MNCSFKERRLCKAKDYRDRHLSSDIFVHSQGPEGNMKG